MFSPSLTGGTICLGCQLRAVTCRTAPVLAAAAHTHTHTHSQTRISNGSGSRRRQYASRASRKKEPVDDFFAVLSQQTHKEPSKKSKTSNKRRSAPAPQDDWDLEPAAPNKHTKKNKQNGTASFLPSRPQDKGLSHGQASGAWPEDDWDLPAQPKEHNVPATAENSLHDAIAENVDNLRPEDDWDPPAQPKEHIGPVTAENTLHDAIATNVDSLGEEDAVRRDSSKSTFPLETELELDQELEEDKTRTETGHSRLETPPFEALEDDKLSMQQGSRYSHGPNIRRREGDRAPLDEMTKLPNIYRKGRTKLVEVVPTLSTQTLGRAAEVIILKEGGDWFMRPYKEDERPLDPGLSLEEHDDQEKGLSLDEIMENIDELRPQHRTLSSRDFKRVFDSLSKGFTSIQLENYVERYLSRVDEGDETPFLGPSPEMVKSKPWIMKQSAWTPKVKGAVEEVDYPLKGYILKSMRPKQRLVMQLMRECWGLSVQELMDGPGVLEVQVRDREFKLLTLGSQRWLQGISRTYLTAGAGNSIQIIKSQKTIRIIAPKPTSETCLEALDEKLQKITKRSLKTAGLPIEQLSDTILEEVGKITNSVVELKRTKQEIEVTWIHIRKDPEAKLEDMADIVFRLLLTAYTPTRVQTAFAIYPDVEGKGQLIGDVGSADKLSWIDRRKKWARLCLPIGAQPPRVSTAWPFNHTSVMHYAVEPVKEDFRRLAITNQERRATSHPHPITDAEPLGLPRSEEPPELAEPDDQAPSTPSGWLPFRIRTSAVFGHVLNPHNTKVASFFQEGIEGLSSFSRALSPVIPPISEMNLPAWVSYANPRTMTSLIIMRFKPYSADLSRPEDPLAPQLELRIKASDDAIIEIDSLRAIAHTHVADMLLPAEPVDARITQKVVAELPGARLDTTEGMQPLLNFLRDARLNMGRGKLVTPPRVCDLGLPRWMFYRPEVDTVSTFIEQPVKRKLKAEAAAAAAAGQLADAMAPYDDDGMGQTKTKKIPSYKKQLFEPAYNALRTTSYLFAGLELHRPLETTFDGWRLAYTSVEAGQAGGRRAELALEAVPGGDHELRRAPADIDGQRFIRSVYKLARGLVSNPVERPGDGSQVRSSIGWLGKGAGL